MDNPITKAFTPLIGLPCWGLDRGQGSILSFEFGEPRLNIREPIVSTSSSDDIRARMARRRVKPVGRWALLTDNCHWQMLLNGTAAADVDASDEIIMAALRQVDGQKLTNVALDPVARTTTFQFDLGATLVTSPYADDQDEQWSLYMPEEQVLTYRADGCHSLGRSDRAPGEEVVVGSGLLLDGQTRRMSPLRAFLTIIPLGGALAILSFVVSMGWQVFQHDILHTNPNRSAAGAMLMAVPMGTIIGAIMTIGHFSLGLLVAAGAFAAAAKRYGFIPLWALIALMPLCTLAIFVQHNALPDVFGLSNGIETPLPPFIIALNLSPHLWSAVLICWLWLRRSTKGVGHAGHREADQAGASTGIRSNEVL